MEATREETPTNPTDTDAGAQSKSILTTILVRILVRVPQVKAAAAAMSSAREETADRIEFVLAGLRRGELQVRLSILRLQLQLPLLLPPPPLLLLLPPPPSILLAAPTTTTTTTANLCLQDCCVGSCSFYYYLHYYLNCY